MAIRTASTAMMIRTSTREKPREERDSRERISAPRFRVADPEDALGTDRSRRTTDCI